VVFCGRRFMSRLKLKVIIAVFLLVSSFSPLYTPVYGEPKQPVNPEGDGGQIWEVTFTGDIDSKSNLVLKKSKTEEDTYFVSGKFSGKMQDERWGAGEIRCELKGRTTKSMFSVKISGYAHIQEGEAAAFSPHRVWGKFRGTLSKSQGFGTWDLQHQYGAPKGEWTAKRIR